MNLDDNIYNILVPLAVACLVLTFAIRLGFSIYNSN